MMKRPSATPAAPAPAPASTRRKALGAAKLALAGALVMWLARSGRLDWRALASLDGRALSWLALAALLQSAMVVAMAARWKAWLQVVPLGAGGRARLSWREALVVIARGTCVGAWTPAGLGLDGIRAAHALRRFRDTDQGEGEGAGEGQFGGLRDFKSLLRGGGQGVGKAARVVGLASLLDRAVAMAVLAALCAPFLASRLSQPQAALLALGALAVVIALAVGCLRGGVLRWRPAACATAWTVLTHVANILAMGAVFQSLAPGLGVLRALEVAFEAGPVIILSSALPLTPLGLGVADATGEALLARHGLDCGGEAVMLARAVWLGVCLLSGIAFWMGEGAEEEAVQSGGAST